ncbi:MAG: SEC-C domain-containing protein, partial [Elusimicrobia bacterium]|nr:SEC-C domain-containing protein [Elusimicrobiota bacterium]
AGSGSVQGRGASAPSALSSGGKASALSAGAAAIRPGSHIGRNDPCYCGSGKKYKKCHGA